MTGSATLPFAAGGRWLDQAWSLWCRRPLFFAATALLVLVVRWSIDTVALGIVVSYFSDALLVAAVWMALSEPDGGGSLASGWRPVKARFGKVLKAGLWGLPSATIGYLLLSVQAPLFQALGMVVGPRIAGWLMLAWIFVVGGICCLMLFGALFAAVEAARGEDRLWTAGMKGMRAAVLGWRPLLGLWTLFVCGATLFAALAAGVLGHLSLAALDGPAREALEYWINWPALYVAVMALLALLVPAGSEMFAAAELSARAEGLTVAAFGERAARRLSIGLKGLGAVVALSGLFVINVGLGTSLGGALCLWLTGRALAAAAPAWSNPDAGTWARWRWLVLTGLPLLLLWAALTAH